jgi:hypothetical protein
MYTNFATLDRYLNILTGSPEFFKFVGATNHSSILKMVHKRDYQTVQNAVNSLKGNEVVLLCL